jgi:hypothetical protein
MQSDLARLIAGRYELQSTLPSHGAVELYDAVDRTLDRAVTVQVLGTGRPEEARKFLRHQQIASSIQHPGVLAVYDAGKSDARPYSVMSRLEGTTPGDLSRPGFPPDVLAALRIGREVAEALQVTRDAGLTDWTFSPEAVRVTPEGAACLAPLEGLAGPASSSRATSDAYALAALLRLMLSGQPQPRAARSDAAPVPDHLLAILGRLENGPASGLGTAGDVASYLADVERSAMQPTQAYEPGILPSGIPGDPSNPGRIASHDAPTIVAPVPIASGAPYDVADEGPHVQAGLPDEPAITTRQRNASGVPYDVPSEEDGHPTEPLGALGSIGPGRLPAMLLPAIAVLTVLALLAFLAPRLWAAVTGPGGGKALAAAGVTSTMVTVPDLRGKPVDEARTAVGEVGLNLSLGNEAYDPGTRARTVAAQEPPALSQVQKGGLVTVTVSLGPAPEPTAPVAAPANPTQAGQQGNGKMGADEKGKKKHGR